MTISDTVATNLPSWVKRSSFLYCNCVSGAISEEAYLEGLRNAGLVDVEVKDRRFYSPSEIEAAVEAMLPSYIVAPRYRGKPLVRDLIRRVSLPLLDRFWSAKFFAKKPLAHATETHVKDGTSRLEA